MADLDRVLHSPPRITIVSRLLVLGPTRFSVLRDAVGMTGGTLSTHLDVLEAAGYVRQGRTLSARGVQKTVQVTLRGREAFYAYVAALERHLDELRRVL